VLNITVDVSQIDRAAEAFAKAPERLKKHLKLAMTDSLSEVLKGAMDRVHVVTGTLRRSITASRPVENEGGGYDGRVGTRVVYGPMEEYGVTNQTQNVRAYTRNVKSRSVFGQVSVQTASGLYGTADTFVSRRRKLAQGIAFVHPFSRIVNRPEHPYMRPGLAASRDAIVRYHQQAVSDALSEINSGGSA
jgi:hypothetical protein